MEKYKLGTILCLLISVIIVFTGCNTDKEPSKEKVINVSSSKTSESAIQNNLSINKTLQNTTENNAFNNDYWRNIEKYSAYIGESFFEVSGEHGNMDYNWDGGSNQFVNAMDNVIFYFPKLVWDSTTCSAVAVEGDNILSDKVKSFDSDNIAAYFGNGYTYHDTGSNGKSYYEYDFNKCIVLIYETPKGGIGPSDMYVIIKSKNETVEISEIISKKDAAVVISSPQKRENGDWDGISEYINKIGRDKSAVLNDGVSWKEYMDSNYYEDLDGNIGYGFDKSDKCSYVCLPMKLLMNEQGNQKLTMKDITEHFNLPFSWFIYEDVGYQYYFDDIVIGIPSDVNGQVNQDAVISISKRME